MTTVESLHKSLQDEYDEVLYSKLVKIIDMITDPQWDKTGRVHDWRNYVPVDEKTWNELSLETRYLVWYMAKEQAAREEWD